jgi:hemoglobin-like flavoprotein
MNPTQVDLVQSSFAKVVPIADVAAELFYNRLFELDPSLRALFRSDMKEQGKKLMAALQAVIGNLKNLDRVVPGVQAMAMRHVSYGVKNSDYAVVGQALIDTLEKGLGADFTPDVREAWLTAYTILANTMKAAASAPRQAA